MTDELSFGERLSAAMGEVAYLEKKGFNDHFKYSFLEEAAVKKAVSEALRKHGLMISSVHYTPIGDCGGKAACIRCELTISDVKGAGSATFSGIGAGADSSDKAPMKAMAASLKYALTSGFLIATGDDPEEDRGTTAKSGKEEPKKASTKAATEPANDNGPDPVADMIAKVEACTTVTELTELKLAVSKLRNESGFDKLKDAFVAKGKALTAAEAGKEAA